MTVRLHILLLILFICTGCAIKPTVQNKYQLESYDFIKNDNKQHYYSIFVSTPLSAEGFQSEQMMYVEKPYELGAFTKNAWVGPPARMLFPLIVQSLQNSRYFYAVTSLPYSDRANYRLDTQLLSFYQSFLTKPSQMKLTVKNVVTNTLSSHVISSKIFNYSVPCPIDNPYGGVIAANQVTGNYTKDLSMFVVQSIQHDKR
tara:strand:+ start:1192 stop:1794 length:603 start_codon:yes stop_codon:yes gene_type:complete